MMRVEREELLRRYLEGGMTLEQEHEFFIQVALDKELRHELKAHQTIDRAFQKDRAVDPSRYATLQGNVAGMITAMSAETESLPESVESVALRSSGSRFQKWMFGALGGVASLLLIAAYLLVSSNGAQTVLPQTAPATVPALVRESDRTDRNSAEANGMMIKDGDANLGDTITVGTTAPVNVSPAQRTSSSSHGGTTPNGLEPKSPDHAPEAASANTANRAEVIPADVQNGGTSHVTVKDDDSLAMKINLHWKKK